MIRGLTPYPAHRSTTSPWLPIVPAGWDVLAVRRLCRVFAGATPSRTRPDYWQDGTIPWLASGDVNARRITGTSQFITQAGFAASSTKWIRPRSLVVALAGQGRTKGMVATVEVPATCNQSLGVLEPDLTRLDYRFLGYYLESRYRDLRGLVGDGIRDGLNLDHLKSISTPVPPLDEQLLIVRFLEHADRRIRRYIAAKRKLIALLDEQKRAILSHAVTRGLDPIVRLRPSGVDWLGDVPEHWRVTRLKVEASHIVDCLHATPQYASGGEYPAIRTADIEPGRVRLSTARTVGRDQYELWTSRLRPQAGDILYSREGERFGIAALVPDGVQLCISQRMMVFRIRPSQSSDFIMWQLNSPHVYAQAAADVIGATSPHVNVERIRNYWLALPPLEEQRMIAAHLAAQSQAIGAAVTRVERELALVREFRARLVSDVVTGKVDVRRAASLLSDEVEVPDELEAPVEDDEEAEADLDAADEADA